MSPISYGGIILYIDLRINPHYSYKNAVNYMNLPRPRLRNTPNLGVFKYPNLLVLLSPIKFCEFFGLIQK